MTSTGVRRTAPLDVLKENFGLRPAVVFDPIDRLVYQMLVDHASMELTGGLSRNVYGWRLPPDSAQAGKYVRNDYHWKNYVARLRVLSRMFDWALKTDIASFFSSIPVERMINQFGPRISSKSVSMRLADMLRGWDNLKDRSGIPQRSIASCVLANFYLIPIDDMLGSRVAFDGGAHATVRWVDDIWIFGRDHAKLRRIQVELQRRLREIRLDMNLAKTNIFERDQLRGETDQLERSAIDYGLRHAPPDVEPLNELIDRILADPERSSRTSIRFATRRMRLHRLYRRANEFASVAARMSHASDALARLFHESGLWRDLGEWYVNYCKSDFACTDWATSQLGTMFPANKKPPDAVCEFFTEILVGDSSLSMTALAAQRLAIWKPQEARSIIRESCRDVSDPMKRRVLGLSALMAGEESAFIRRLFGEFEENQVVLSMLEDRDFLPLPATKDYSSG